MPDSDWLINYFIADEVKADEQVGQPVRCPIKNSVRSTLFF